MFILPKWFQQQHWTLVSQARTENILDVSTVDIKVNRDQLILIQVSQETTSETDQWRHIALEIHFMNTISPVSD